MNAAYPISFFDSPEVVDCAVTPIPPLSGQPMQVIAKTSGSQAGKSIAYIDTTGMLIGVFTGAVGQEVLSCVVGNGLASSSAAVFPAGCRVSLRSMSNIAINAGTLNGVI